MTTHLTFPPDALIYPSEPVPNDAHQMDALLDLLWPLNGPDERPEFNYVPNWTSVCRELTDQDTCSHAQGLIHIVAREKDPGPRLAAASAFLAARTARGGQPDALRRVALSIIVAAHAARGNAAGVCRHLQDLAAASTGDELLNEIYAAAERDRQRDIIRHYIQKP